MVINDYKELQKLQADFRNKFQILKDAKKRFFDLFRSKLEKKKIEEIKKHLS